MVRSIAALSLVLALGNSAVAGLILQIISGPTASESSLGNSHPGINIVGFTRGPGIVADSGSTFNSSGFNVGGSEANAITTGDYIEWSFASPTAFDLDDFDIRYDRSLTGPSSLRIDFNPNNSGFITVFSDSSVSETGENVLGVSLSAFDNVSNGRFRLYAWGATAASGTFDFENAAAIGTNSSGSPVSFELNGTITAVPEPSSMALLSAVGGAAAVLKLRRRGKKSQTTES